MNAFIPDGHLHLDGCFILEPSAMFGGDPSQQFGFGLLGAFFAFFEEQSIKPTPRDLFSCVLSLLLLYGFGPGRKRERRADAASCNLIIRSATFRPKAIEPLQYPP